MNQYKIVKRAGYDTIYDVYQKVLWFWWKKGYCASASLEEKDIVTSAWGLVSPKVIYFDA